MNHSNAQQRLFFALVKELGLNKEVAKERAKKRYGVASFSDLNPEHLHALIAVLEKRIEDKKPPEKKLPFQFRAAYSKNGETLMYYFSLYDVIIIDAQLAIPTNDGDTVALEEADAIMQFTGKKDYFRQNIFQMDILLDRRKNKWMTQWGEKELAWVAIDMYSNETKLLATLGSVKIIGNMFHGITEENEKI